MTDTREPRLAAPDARHLGHLVGMFSNLEPKAVQDAWIKSNRNITTCVETLSALR